MNPGTFQCRGYGLVYQTYDDHRRHACPGNGGRHPTTQALSIPIQSASSISSFISQSIPIQHARWRWVRKYGDRSELRWLPCVHKLCCLDRGRRPDPTSNHQGQKTAIKAEKQHQKQEAKAEKKYQKQESKGAAAYAEKCRLRKLHDTEVRYNQQAKQREKEAAIARKEEEERRRKLRGASRYWPKSG